MSKSEKIRAILGGILLLASAVIVLADYFLSWNTEAKPYFKLGSALGAIGGIILLLSVVEFSLYFFDPGTYEPNDTMRKLVRSLRLRAILFNNLSVVIFIFIILVIITGFVFLVNPPVHDRILNGPIDITVRAGTSVLLIFLVQILFRVFKYLLRVAAFYNAKADGLEFYEIKKEDPELEKVMELFTPSQYDITDVSSPTFFESLKK